MVFWTLLFGILLMTNFLNGFIEVILGPILYDLRCLLHTDLKSLSYLFLALSLGMVPGCATSHFIISRFRPFLILFVLVLTQSLALCALPLAPVIYLTALCVCVSGFSVATNVLVLLHLLDVYWAGSTRRLYLLMSMFSVGSVCCPLILHPFLSYSDLTHTVRNRGIISNFSTSYKDTGNASSIGVSECQVLWQYPCFLIAFIGVCVAFCHLIFHLKIKEDIQSSSYINMTSDANRTEPTKLHMVLIFLFFLPSFPMTFAGLLTSYGSSGRQIALSTLNRMLSVFWTFFLVGRLLPAFLPVSIKQKQIMLAALFCQFLGGLLLLGTRFSREAFLWSSCVLLGYSGGAYLVTGISWTAEIIEMNVARKAVCLTSASAGFILANACGFLMYLYGDESFEYFLCGVGIYSGVMFILLDIVLHVF